MHDLGSLGGATQPLGINPRGQIVGTSSVAGTGSHAFLWTRGVMVDLGTFPGGIASVAFAINPAGQIVGESYLASGKRHAALWDPGVMKDLGTLGGQNSVAQGINPKGDPSRPRESSFQSRRSI